LFEVDFSWLVTLLAGYQEGHCAFKNLFQSSPEFLLQNSWKNKMKWNWLIQVHLEKGGGEEGDLCL